jgi:hypothetical protein
VRSMTVGVAADSMLRNIAQGRRIYYDSGCARVA